MAQKLYRLREPGTIFTDPESGFTISGSECKPLPKKMGPVLRARVISKGLVEVEKPTGKAGKGEIPLDPPLSKGEEKGADETGEDGDQPVTPATGEEHTPSADAATSPDRRDQ